MAELTGRDSSTIYRTAIGICLPEEELPVRTRAAEARRRTLEAENVRRLDTCVRNPKRRVNSTYRSVQSWRPLGRVCAKGGMKMSYCHIEASASPRRGSAEAPKPSL